MLYARRSENDTLYGWTLLQQQCRLVKCRRFHLNLREATRSESLLLLQVASSLLHFFISFRLRMCASRVPSNLRLRRSTRLRNGIPQPFLPLKQVTEVD